MVTQPQENSDIYSHLLIFIQIYDVPEDGRQDDSPKVKPNHFNSPEWLFPVLVMNPASSTLANRTWTKLKSQQTTNKFGFNLVFWPKDDSATIHNILASLFYNGRRWRSVLQLYLQ